ISVTWLVVPVFIHKGKECYPHGNRNVKRVFVSVLGDFYKVIDQRKQLFIQACNFISKYQAYFFICRYLIVRQEITFCCLFKPNKMIVRSEEHTSELH